MKTFRQKVTPAKTILIINALNLGDVIHSLPATRMIKQTIPAAEIDFLSSSHSSAIFQLVPDVRHVMSVPNYPRPKSRMELYRRRARVMWQVARQHYDAVITLAPNDWTGGVAALSFARNKLAVRRIYFDTKFRAPYTDLIDTLWQNQSYSKFILDALTEVGFDECRIPIGPDLLNLNQQLVPISTARPYFHISLFASKESRQLPISEAQKLIAGLLNRYPEHELVISCANVKRERTELSAILDSTDRSRVTVYAGTFNVAELAALLAHSDLHIGPDTGTLHLAWLAGARTVSWFLNHESLMAWVPYGPQHRVVLSVREQVRTGPDGQAMGHRIRAITAAHILDTAEELMSANLPPKRDWWTSDRVEFRYVD